MSNSSIKSFDKPDSSKQLALPSLIAYRKSIWFNHCNYILKNFLLGWAEEYEINNELGHENLVVLIENRIDKQWLFTVLNTMLMCPQNTNFCLIVDSVNETKARQLLSNYKFYSDLIWINIENINSSISLDDLIAFNQFMKSSDFWSSLPNERLLIIQTDALLSESLPEFFFRFDYLGSPFLPRVRSEYFEDRLEANGEITNFFKVDTPIHCSPNKDVYPHLYGNGGLSIRNRSLMQKICNKYSQTSPLNEQEDVFFSRKINEFIDTVPIQIAKAFSFETTFNKESIGCHAAWKYLTTNELAEYLDKHLRQVFSMIG